MVTIQDRTLSVWGEQIQTRVKIAGQGPPLVFLHGATGLRWDEFLDSLTQTHTVYAPEHPGTTPGDPDAIKPLDDFWDLVLYYYDLFDGLGLESPAVVGHSFGGMVAAELAATDPRRVGKLVLISSLGLWRDDAPVKNWMSMGRGRPGQGTLLRAGGTGREGDTGGVRGPGGAADKHDPEHVEPGLHGQVHLADSRQGAEEAHTQDPGADTGDLGTTRRNRAGRLRPGVH